MYARIVELQVKAGKEKELNNKIADQILTLLKAQPGFVDEITLVSDKNPRQLLAMSLWKSREDAERYHRDKFKEVVALIRPLVEGEPTPRTYDVNTSTGHRIAAGKAA